MNRLHRWYCRTAHWNRTLAVVVPWALSGVDLGDHVLELGPGPGGVTPWLRSRSARVTTLDPDPRAAHGVRGDATRLPFASGTFSAVVALTMLHHVRTAELQDQLFRESRRVLRPGGVFAGIDVRASRALRLFHLGDAWMPLAPDTLASRLTRAGLEHAIVETQPRYVRFAAVRPLPLS